MSTAATSGLVFVDRRIYITDAVHREKKGEEGDWRKVQEKFSCPIANKTRAQTKDATRDTERAQEVALFLYIYNTIPSTATGRTDGNGGARGN